MAAASKRLKFEGHEGLSTKADGDTWLTPRYILDSLGWFDFDPCPAPQNPGWVVPGTVANYDGLAVPWLGRVFMNPPFSNTVNWLAAAAAHGNGIALVPATVESRIWREVVWGKSKGVLLLHGRTRFCNPDGSATTGRPLRGVALIAWTDGDAAILHRSPLAGVRLQSWKQV